MAKTKTLYKLFSLSFALFIYTNASFADEMGMPLLLNKLPTYYVKSYTSYPLPSAEFTLTDKGLRILPRFFKDAKPSLEFDSKLPLDAPRITLNQADDTPYCDKAKKICWPKNIEIAGGFIAITTWNNNTLYYNDTYHLEEFLWNELRAPLKEMKK